MSARLRLAALALVVAALLCAATAWLLSWPLQKAVVLAPVIVAFVGTAVGIVVFWSRVAYESLKASRNPRLMLALAAGLVALIGVLTALGIELPRE